MRRVFASCLSVDKSSAFIGLAATGIMASANIVAYFGINLHREKMC